MSESKLATNEESAVDECACAPDCVCEPGCCENECGAEKEEANEFAELHALPFAQRAAIFNQQFQLLQRRLGARARVISTTHKDAQGVEIETVLQLRIEDDLAKTVESIE